MIQIRPSEDRGRNKLSWLDTHFTFSFDQYFDPEHVQFRSLRVLNEDVVAPGKGFPTHPHRDMEILTWVLDVGRSNIATIRAAVECCVRANCSTCRRGRE